MLRRVFVHAFKYPYPMNDDEEEGDILDTMLVLTLMVYLVITMAANVKESLTTLL